MSEERTPDEWRELARRLTEVANDPQEELDRRRRARGILATIPKNYLPPAESDWTQGLTYTDDWEGII